jgi:amino acid adenylation domain-containing protein
MVTKHESFDELLRREGIALPVLEGIPRCPGPREGEASFAQKRIWINQKLDPRSTVYNVMLTARIEGTLAHAAVEQALETIVERHEALRTCFTTVNGRPFQKIRSGLAAGVNYVDVVGLDGDEVLQIILASRQQTPFHLEMGPLFNVTLVRMTSNVNVLVLAVHHIIFDFVSSQIIFDEFCSLYGQYANGAVDTLPAVPIQYLDYSEWQRSRFELETNDDTLKYWKERLGTGDEIPTLDLPGDGPPTDELGFQPAVEKFVIPLHLAGRVRRMSANSHVSAFAVWLAGFQILLQRYSGAVDVLVCVPHSERDNPDLERVIGFFVNFVVIKLSVEAGRSFESLIRAVHEEYVEATGSRAYPFEKLVEALSPQRHQGVSRLGEVGFGYQHISRSTWDIGALRVRILDPDVPLAKSELSLSIYEAPEQCHGQIEYNAAKYSRAMIRKMAGYFCSLLTNLLDSPDRPVGSITWSRSAGIYGCEIPDENVGGVLSDCLHRTVEDQSRTTPDSMALVMGSVHLTYRALDRGANQIARSLIGRHGVGCDSVVAVCLPRTVESYLCILAVFKSGAVYVPIDRSYPPAYVREMIGSADVTHMILSADGGWCPTAPDGRPVCVVDAAALTLQNDFPQAGDPAGAPVSGEQTAYVCFTSGTTGESKGISVSHRALALHVRSFRKAIGIENVDRVLQFSALGFDVSLEQIFSAWSAGATLLPRGDDVWGVREFVELLDREQVSIANPPTAYWNQVVGLGAASDVHLPSGALRCMIVGGEPMQMEMVRRWRCISHRGIRLINAYGPTEAVITATIREFDSDKACVSGVSVPIGDPLPGRIAYILDGFGLPVPDGVPGELCLAGASLAHGYLKKPRETAEHFCPEPQFGAADPSHAGALIYRTGDLVRRLPDDGSIQYLRRNDDEIKVRGARVRPSFIESLLAGNPQILEAAVVVRDRHVPHPAVSQSQSEGEETDWRWLLDQVPLAFVERSIREVEEANECATSGAAAAGAPREDVMRIVKRTPDFSIVLELKNRDFISTRRNAQKNWVVSRTLDECADELCKLHALTKRFVASSERTEIRGDLSLSAPDCTRGELVMDGQQVMQSWQMPLMRALAGTVTARRGDVLEVGFGMGLSANCIQERGVRSHFIIEANNAIVETAKQWKANYPHADIRIVHSRWEDVIDELGVFDGILFDTYPLTEAEFRRHVVDDTTFAAHFFPLAAEHLRDGGVFTYYSNEIDSLSRTHQRRLLEVFSSFNVSVVHDLQPAANSQNWWTDSMAVVAAYK